MGGGPSADNPPLRVSPLTLDMLPEVCGVYGGGCER